MCSGIASSENPQRFHFIPANWAAKHGVSWAADLKAKLQMVPNFRKFYPTPSLFLFPSTAVAKQQFATFSVLPQTSSLSSALPVTCTHAQPCFSPGCSLQGAQVHQALFIGMSAQKQTQCWRQNRSCPHGSYPYTPGWHVFVSCKSDPVQEAAEIFLSPLLASHAPGISIQLPEENCCILTYTGKQRKHSSRVIKGIIQKEDRKGFTIPCTALPRCCSVMP